jgi:hypothetical protein
MAPTATAARRRRSLVALAVPALLLLAGLAAFVRGTWADTAPRDPADVADGPVCQVYRPPGGETEVRCAIRLPIPLDEVWAAVTDYDHYGDICPYVRAARVEHDPAGTTRVQAFARTGVGRGVQFEAELRHEQGLYEYVSSWDQAGGAVQVNRGRWVLRETGPRETLLAVSLEVQVRGVPTFVLRNLSLYRLRRVALAVERRLREGVDPQPW